MGSRTSRAAAVVGVGLTAALLAVIGCNSRSEPPRWGLWP